MRRKNLRILAAVSAGTDALLIFLSYFIALDLRFRVLDGYVSISMNSAPFRWMMAAYALVVVTICAGLHLYQPFRNRRFLRTAGLFMAVNAMATGVLMSVLFTLKIIDFSRMTLMLFWVVSTVLVCAKTLATRRLLYRLRRQGRMLRHVIVIGNGKNARTYMEEARRQPELGLKVEGYVSGMPKKGLGKNLGRYEDLGRILEKGSYDSLVVALEPHEISFMPAVLEAAEKEGVRVEMIPLYNQYYPTHPTIESIGETKLVDLRATPLDNLALAAVKRGGDILLSLTMILLLSPLMAAIALGVRLSGPGPVLFKQERVGKDKKPFVMLKFRSMRADIDHSGWSTDEDARKTRFGSLIRKFSLDELPQLFNVLAGSMSLVGPRPELPVYVRRFKEEVPLYLVRQQVRPGMTGWAQVHGLRGDTSIEERVVHDIWYIQNWSLGLDLKILLRTVFGGMKNNEKLSPRGGRKPGAEG